MSLNKRQDTGYGIRDTGYDTSSQKHNIHSLKFNGVLSQGARNTPREVIQKTLCSQFLLVILSIFVSLAT